MMQLYDCIRDVRSSLDTWRRPKELIHLFGGNQTGAAERFDVR